MIYQMFAMVILTFSILILLFRGRVRAVREGRASLDFFKIYQGGAEPESTAKLARHFANLFEAPTLFYVVCLAAMIMQLTGPGMQVLGWLYVAARLAHAYIHVGGNRIRYRVRAYFSSWVVLLAMWLTLVIGVAARHGSLG